MNSSVKLIHMEQLTNTLSVFASNNHYSLRVTDNYLIEISALECMRMGSEFVKYCSLWTAIILLRREQFNMINCRLKMLSFFFKQLTLKKKNLIRSVCLFLNILHQNIVAGWLCTSAIHTTHCAENNLYESEFYETKMDIVNRFRKFRFVLKWFNIWRYFLIISKVMLFYKNEKNVHIIQYSCH